MAEGYIIDNRWGWLRAHAFAAEPIYCESAAKEEDVAFSGSEDDHYEEPSERKRRYEERGRQFLAGEAPRLLSTCLTGPFDEASGWINPWRATGGRVVNPVATATTKIAKSTKPKKASKKPTRRARAPPKAAQVHSDEDEVAQQEASDVEPNFADHVPEDSLLVENSDTPEDTLCENPYMGETDIARVQDWMDDVNSKALPREGFWVQQDAGSKKRSSNPDWLRRKLNKRTRLSFAEDDAVESPIQAVLQNRLAHGPAASPTGKDTDRDELPEEHTMATAQSPLSSVKSAQQVGPEVSSQQANPAAPMSVEETSQEHQLPRILSIGSNSQKVSPEVTSQYAMRTRSRGTGNLKASGTLAKRKNDTASSSDSQPPRKASRRSHRLRSSQGSDSQGSRNPTSNVAIEKQISPGPAFKSQQDDSFCFRAKPRPIDRKRRAEEGQTSVHASDIDTAKPPLSELPEPASPSPAQGPANLPSSQSKPPPTTSSSIRVRGRRAIRDSIQARQRISNDEPTIVELGSPFNSKIAKMKAIPMKEQIVVQSSPASTSDLSEVPSFAGTEIDYNDIPSQYAVVKGLPQPQEDPTAVQEQEEDSAVPSQYADLKGVKSREEMDFEPFINDTTLLPSQSHAHIVPESYAEIKEQASASVVPENYAEIKGQTGVSVVPENYAEIKGQTGVPVVPETYAELKGQIEAPVVPETYAELKGQHDIQQHPPTSAGTKSQTWVKSVDIDLRRPSEFLIDNSGSPHLPPVVQDEPCSSDTSSESSSEASPLKDDAVTTDVEGEEEESNNEEADEEPDDSALVILPLTREAWGMSAVMSSPQKSSPEKSSPQKATPQKLDDSTPSLPKAEVKSVLGSPETPRIGTQDQSPWATRCSPKKQNSQAARVELAAIEEGSDQAIDAENQSPFRSQELPIAPVGNPGSSLTRGPHALNNSQDLPSPLPERNVLAATSGNRMQSPNPVRPSTPDTKQSSLPTPDFTFSIKSFRRLLSASPERRTSQSRASIGSILSNPWTRSSKPARRVHFDLPADEEHVDAASSPSSTSSDDQADDNDEDYIEAGLPKQQKRPRVRTPRPEIAEPRPRAASPPPMVDVDDLPDEVEKFQKHYSSMESRRVNGKAARLQKSLLPSESQQVVGSPDVGAMAERFIATEIASAWASPMAESICGDVGEKDKQSVEQPIAKSAILQDEEPSQDDVSAVLDNLGDFLTTWDVDKEVDLSRTEMSESTGRRASMFTGGLELETNVWR